MLGLIILDELNPLLRLVVHFGHLSNSPFLKKVCLLPLQGQHLTKYQVAQRLWMRSETAMESQTPRASAINLIITASTH